MMRTQTLLLVVLTAIDVKSSCDRHTGCVPSTDGSFNTTADSIATKPPPPSQMVVSTLSGPVSGQINGTRFAPACLFFPATKFLPQQAHLHLGLELPPACP